LVQFLALVVLIVVFLIFGYKPVKKMLNKRQDHIEENIKEAEENNEISKRNIAESEQLILDSKKEANQIISDAKEKALVESSQIVLDAENEAKVMKRRAEEEIKQKEADSLDAIHQEMVNVALDASSELLKRNITSDDNRQLVKDFIDDISEAKDE
ncbi:MAG: F0F1 ATP synthase subunit B, partial [Coprobacillus sp.]|nr:F0F1 ATP synthase subunit B [Coprobacillus sp.]